MAREKIIVKRGYKKGNTLQPQYTQRTMKHIPNDHKIIEIDYREDGLVERDGKEYVYHLLRVLIETPETKAG